MKSRIIKKGNFDYICQKNLNKFILCRKRFYSSAMQSLLNNPESFLHAPETEYLRKKNGDPSTVGIITIDQQKLVLKRYNLNCFSWRKKLKYRIKLWFHKSRAMISLNNAHRLMALNILTAEPIAVIEQRFPLCAYYIYQYVEGISGECLRNKNELTEKFSPGLVMIASVMKKLKSAFICHRDFQAKNIIMSDEKIFLLDLERMKKYYFFKRRVENAYKKDVERFLNYLGSNEQAKEIFMRALEN